MTNHHSRCFREVVVTVRLMSVKELARFDTLALVDCVELTIADEVALRSSSKPLYPIDMKAQIDTSFC